MLHDAGITDDDNASFNTTVVGRETFLRVCSLLFKTIQRFSIVGVVEDEYIIFDEGATAVMGQVVFCLFTCFLCCCLIIFIDNN